MSDLYERDFYAWANEQAALLRAGNFPAADIANIAEEIESLGRGENCELVSRLTVLFLRLLTWQYQPNLRGTSWRVSVMNTRAALARHMRDNPSLKSRLPEAVSDAYEDARRAATAETGLPEEAFPAACPWPFEQAMDGGFWPGAAGCQ